MADQQILAARGPRPDAMYLVSADQVTITGDGASDRPLVAHLTSGPPTVEHLAVTGSGTLSPTIDVSFVRETAGPSTSLSLGDGTTDGFLKVIALESGDDTNWHVFASGVRVNFTGGGGALTLRWDATEGEWVVVSTFGGTVV